MSKVFVDWSHEVAEIEYAAGKRGGNIQVVMDPALSIGRAMTILEEIAPNLPVQFARVSRPADQDQLEAV